MAIRRPRANGVAAPRKFDRNVIVIGAGSAGLTAAYLAAKAGAKVTLIEAHKMGGDCLNTGCVPSKALIKSARAAAAAREASRYGLKDAEPAIDFAEVMARVRGVIDAIRPHDSEETFEGYGVDVVRGYARFVDPWTVEIKLNHGGFSRLTARHFVVATGSEPIVPSIDGVEDSAYLTSENAVGCDVRTTDHSRTLRHYRRRADRLRTGAEFSKARIAGHGRRAVRAPAWQRGRRSRRSRPRTDGSGGRDGARQP